MCVLRNMALLTLVFCVFSLSGCSRSPDIIFPNKWAGDIDKTGFNEPSGICWHGGRKTLFVVGDEGDLCEIKTDGTLVKQEVIRQGADFEGVTHDPSTGLLYLALEEAESIVEVNPETFKILREFSIPRQFKGKTLLKEGAEGIEAITFVPDRNNKEGGYFYVANQSFVLTNEQDISAIFKVIVPLRSKTGKVEIEGYFEPGIIDLSGLYYDSANDTIVVVSDATNTIMEFSCKGKLLSIQAFPGDNQEGITVCPEDYIYIAQDTGGILKLKWLR